MVTSKFEYFAPTTLDEASSLLSRYRGQAKLLAGGHSLVPLMKLRLAEPEYLIDLSRVEGLSYIRDLDGGLSIGAMTTYNELQNSPLVRQRAPMLADAAGKVADMQVRNRGTLGGSLAHSDPAGDIPAVVLALNATLIVRTPRSSREIPADRFQVDMLTTALRENEILTEIQIPAAPMGTGMAYTKFHNKASHYAIVGVAAVVTTSNGVVEDARVAVTGAGPKATRARRTERILRDKEPTDAVIRRAASRAAAEIGDEMNDDIHASAEYREHLTQVYAERAIRQALADAR